VINTTDRVKPKNLPARIARLEASTELFLVGIKQAFSDADEERLAVTVRELRSVPGALESPRGSSSQDQTTAPFAGESLIWRRRWGHQAPQPG